MITLDMVKRGYEAGIIKVEASVISGISCEIQDMNLRLSTELAFDDFMHWNAEHIVERVFNYLKNEVKKEDSLYVERVLNEGLKERAKSEEENVLAWKTSDEMVDLALKDFKGFHDGQSSGLYGLGDFVVDDERMELVVSIYQYMDEGEHRPYYGVYYWVGYYGDDALFADWEYTSSLDVNELKQLVSDLSGRDFTEDVRKEITPDYDYYKDNKPSLNEQIQSVSFRSAVTQSSDKVPAKELTPEH